MSTEKPTAAASELAREREENARLAAELVRLEYARQHLESADECQKRHDAADAVEKERDSLRAENERLHAFIASLQRKAPDTGLCDGVAHVDPEHGEIACMRLAGHSGEHVALAGDALAADLAEARAEVEALRREREPVFCHACAHERPAGPGLCPQCSAPDALATAYMQVAALTARAEKAEAERDAAVAHAAALVLLSKQSEMAHETHPFLPDWACAACRPESDMLIAGFRCGRHAARDALSGGTSALDAHDAALIAEARKRIEAKRESVELPRVASDAAYEQYDADIAFNRGIDAALAALGGK